MARVDRTTPGCPLPELLERLLPIQLHVLGDPGAGRGTSICGTVLEGPGEPLAPAPGALLLLVGANADPALTRRTLEQASTQGFAGVVVRPRGSDTTGLVEAATRLGLILLVLTEEMGWRELAALVDAVLESYVETSPAARRAGDELFTIADAIASTVGGSVAVEDLARRVLAYSSMPGQRIDAIRSQGILDRQVPALLTDAEQYGAVLASAGVVRFPTLGGELARAATAIRAGGLQLGTIWVIEGDDGLTPQGELALTEGARLAALFMLRARRAPEVDQQLRGELLRTLLNGTGDEAMVDRLGLANGAPRALIAVGPPSASGIPDVPLAALAAQEATRQVGALRPDAAVVSEGPTIYVLVSGREADVAATRLASTLLTALDRLVGRWASAGIATDEHGRRTLAALRSEADDVLRALRSPSSARTATLRDVRTRVLLRYVGLELSRRTELWDPVLREFEAGRAGGVHLAESLIAWFEALFDVRKAADALFVHPNTLRYRLRRIAELTGLDLEDADACLGLWLQLRVQRDLLHVPASN